jgi:L,D-transpeptidase YbiS
MRKQPHIEIDIQAQQLRLLNGGIMLLEYPVSTAINGVGELNGSECTPRGWHIIRAKIGAGCPHSTIFVGRRPSGVYAPDMRAAEPTRDWILTRILWLSGIEKGRNRLGSVDTMRRYIYIHGSPDDALMGAPGSHGCVRMRNDDVLELYDRVEAGTRVLIRES